MIPEALKVSESWRTTIASPNLKDKKIPFFIEYRELKFSLIDLMIF
jgi:hypothetical protein